MIFLCVLNQGEEQERKRALTLNLPFTPSIAPPYRWSDWAQPEGEVRKCFRDRDFFDRYFLDSEQASFEESDRLNPFRTWVNQRLFPHLRRLGDQPSASARHRIISRIFAYREGTLVESEANLLDALDEIDRVCGARIDEQHMFPISQAFEGLLPRMGEKKNDGGQFFTPREIIRVVVRAVNPQLGRSVYDPCCGTGGFLIEAFKHLMNQNPSGTQIAELKTTNLWGREDANIVIPICLANMVLHGIDLPRIWHGNTLTRVPTYEGLFEGAPNVFDYVLTNPPFGGKENKTAQAQFAYKSGKTQILFLQHVIDLLGDKGTCGMVIDEGVLFHTNTAAYRQTKAKLLNECDVWCVVSLPPNVFVNAGAAGKTNLLFFTRGSSTQRIWYYDLSDRHVTKNNPLTSDDFEDFFRRLILAPSDKNRISEKSWWVDFETIRDRNYDMRAMNQNRREINDGRSPEQLVTIIRKAGQAITAELEHFQEEHVMHSSLDKTT
jgi:type I restriction enzyme M protein